MLLLARLLAVATTANAWQRWEYKADATQQWKELWGLERGPGARRGHSLVLHHKPATETEKATTKIVLFGGRSNEIFKQHVPKTYEIKISSGTIDFVSYDKSPIKTEMCTTDPDTGEQVCKNPINVGLYFNDVWAYELDCYREGTTAQGEQAQFCGGVFNGDRCTSDDDCEETPFKKCEEVTFGSTANYDASSGTGPCPATDDNQNAKSWACLGSDLPCEDQAWKELDYGARRGGCRYVLGREVCTHPSERWRHGASMFDDSTMLVYGGFSQRCEDYCDDLWAFDVRDNTWMEIYEVGKFAFGDAPGKRWRFSLVSDGQRYPCPKALEEQNQDEIECGRFYIFGGFRLWHGFARDNSEDNRWRSNEELPDGGYMDDLWVYNKRLLNPDEPMPTSSAGLGLWRNYTGKATCVDEPGATWEGRDDQNCEVEWPTARAGHTSALDAKNGGVYVFGGYTTFFPYLSTDGPGSGWGAAAKPNAKGFIPFPDYPYYLNDLWVYNLTTGYWTLLVPLSSDVPAPRTDMSMVLDMGYCRSSVDDDGACFGPMLIVFGGYNGSHHFDDTWLFDTRKTRWLEKRQQVHPLWPPGCTDDDEIIANSSCFLLDYARPVRPDGLVQAQRHDLSDLYDTIHVVVVSKTDMAVDSTKKDSPPLVGTSVAPAQLVGGAAACASEADEGCAGFDWWSLDPNNTKMVHLLNMAVCSHDRMMSCRVDGDCSFHEASSTCIKKSKYIEFSAFPFYGIVDKDGPRPDPQVDKPKFGDPIVKYAATGPNQWVTGPRYWDEDWLKDHFRRRDCGTKQFDDRECSFWSQDLSRDVAFLENYTVSYNKSLPEIKNGKKFRQDFEAYRGVYYRRCTSVYGDATRGGTLGWHPKAPDGLNGRANGSVLIPQKRRRAPGWDGCRDTCFGVHPNEPGLYPGERQKFPDRFECPSNASLILDTGLQYLRPNQRSDHAAILVPHLGRWTTNTRALGEIYMFGGVGYGVEQKQTTDHTFPSVVLDDMWRLGVHDCPNNCNNQGNCSYGFCQCHRGYYGADCSNISCPGDFCYVDQDTNEQVCQHCCQAGYNHTEHDKYQVDVPRVPCTFASHRQDGSFGESNGICDGFGTCQCAPPFINDDCSIRDCDHNCSHRGHCSVEFPVSRCICDPGYYGKHCQYQVCLNNCSYPNGLCNHTTGLCTCEMIYSPYQNWRPYQRWGGEDCSFLSDAKLARNVHRLPAQTKSSIYIAARSLRRALCTRPATAAVQEPGRRGGGSATNRYATAAATAMPKKKRAESPAPEDLCEGGKCIGVVFEDHRQPVYAVAFWPGASDEPMVAVCGSNRASVYAIAEGDIELRQVYVDNDRDESFFCCAWSRRADAPLLCVAGTRGIAKIVDCADGRLDCALVGHGNAINDCCFHAVDESLLLTASKDESIRLWNARTCVCIAVFAGDRGHRDEVLAVDCHQSGSCCLSSGMDNTIKLWQLDAEHVAKACERSHTNPQPANHRPFETVFEQFPAFSTSRVHANYVDCARWVGSLILSKSTAERLCLWSPDPQRNERLPAPLLSETNDDSEPKDDVLIVHELDLPGADIWFLRFGMCSSRQYVCAGNTSGDLVIYDVDSTEQKASLTHPKMRGAVRQCAFSPDSSLVACVGDDAGLFVYELDK